MDKFNFILKDELEKLPKTAGVYLFYATKPVPNTQHLTPIYIGKAINIKDRVKNHFFQPTYKDDLYIQKVGKIGFMETSSEIEALILEASLIKKHQPKFNAVWRDDKNYFFVAIVKNKQKVPYVFITHQPRKSKVKGQLSNVIYIGPFTEGTALKKTLKFLRRVFPYYTSATHPKNKCTWCHLGLCPGPVRNTARVGAPEGPVGRAVSNGAGPYLDLAEYKKNIKKLALILQGKRKTVWYNLKKEMAILSKQKKFEEALMIRDKINALQQVMAHTQVINNPSARTVLADGWGKTEKILSRLLYSNTGSRMSATEVGTSGQEITPISKIECYDISNIQGTQAVGSMVVFVNGKPDKSQYKKFRIRMENKPNDIAMLKEVLVRRLARPEWGYPQIMLIDGGIAQLNIGIKSKNEARANSEASEFAREIGDIKIISIAKGKRELLMENKPKIPLKELPREIYNLIVALDDEAHRFAITYHRKLRKKELLGH